MTIKELEELAEQLGLESSLLDDYVHEAASQMASAANNAGREEQIRFMAEYWGEGTTETELRKLAKLAEQTDDGEADET